MKEAATEDRGTQRIYPLGRTAKPQECNEAARMRIKGIIVGRLNAFVMSKT